MLSNCHLLKLLDVKSADAFESDESRRGDVERAARLVVAGEMVAAITHDLRQPLTAIEMNVAAALRLLEARDATATHDTAPRIAEAVAALRDALAEQRRMREALQVLQDLAARREPSFVPLDVEKSVQDVVRLVSSDAFARHIHIDVTCASSLPQISADEALMRQALLNVLIDALESTSTSESGKGSVTVEVQPFGANSVETVVTHVGTRPRATAEGWALALARSVADVHGATLAVQSDPSQGTSVSIRWPIGVGPATDLGAAGGTAGGAGAIS
jgi:signal transduction histidine kinase